MLERKIYERYGRKRPVNRNDKSLCINHARHHRQASLIISFPIPSTASMKFNGNGGTSGIIIADELPPILFRQVIRTDDVFCPLQNRVIRAAITFEPLLSSNNLLHSSSIYKSQSSIFQGILLIVYLQRIKISRFHRLKREFIINIYLLTKLLIVN